MTMPKHFQDAQQNRERILNVASTLMSERGFAGTTIAAICKEASVVPPTLYWHFGDKEGLITAVMENAAEQWHARFLPTDNFDPLSSAHETAEAMFLERPEFLRLMLLIALEQRKPGTEGRMAIERTRERAMRSWSKWLEEMLTEIESPKERQDAALQLSEFLLVQVDGIFISCQVHPDNSDFLQLWSLSQIAIRAAAAELIRQSKTKTERISDKGRS